MQVTTSVIERWSSIQSPSSPSSLPLPPPLPPPLLLLSSLFTICMHNIQYLKDSPAPSVQRKATLGWSSRRRLTNTIKESTEERKLFEALKKKRVAPHNALHFTSYYALYIFTYPAACMHPHAISILVSPKDIYLLGRA